MRIGRRSTIQCLITFDFWAADVQRCEAAWKTMLETLELAEFIADPASCRSSMTACGSPMPTGMSLPSFGSAAGKLVLLSSQNLHSMAYLVPIYIEGGRRCCLLFCTPLET
jgi:hypothetical protein